MEYEKLLHDLNDENNKLIAILDEKSNKIQRLLEEKEKLTIENKKLQETENRTQEKCSLHPFDSLKIENFTISVYKNGIKGLTKWCADYLNGYYGKNIDEFYYFQNKRIIYDPFAEELFNYLMKILKNKFIEFHEKIQDAKLYKYDTYDFRYNLLLALKYKFKNFGNEK